MGSLLFQSLTLALCLPLLAGFLTPRAHRHSREGATRTASFLSDDNRDCYDVEEVGVNAARLVHPYMALVIPRGVRNTTSRGSAFILDTSEINGAVSGEASTNLDVDENCLYLLTAAHVAAPGMDIDLRFAKSQMDDETVRGTVLGRNQTLDLALLRIDISSIFDNPTDATNNLQCGGLTLATCLPHTGTRTFAHGFPASRLRGPAMTSGIVCGVADGLGVPQDQETEDSSNNNKTDDTTYIVTDAAMSPGMSGGPLTDRHGRVLGINALIRPDLRALGNYAVSSEEIRYFLQHDCTNTQMATNQQNKGGVSERNIRYRVLLFNDRMNKRERVSQVLCQVAKLNEDDANNAMMEAHKTGTGMVKEFEGRADADSLCQELKQEDLLVEVDAIHLPDSAITD